ncbi:conjugal transfer protein TraL [Massilia sp. TW-1]|uniref:Conjugal transfer protein TraL n=1 Tax=Telluria antibiotica TaxID=2717319 RepID=A0ABX0PHP9_9BURK|nr:conjugal transfer protein TraL [Telluria antibiotica]NIA56977.1 conjugal transfer protein TraL [Telluria antibiotica]
MAKAHFVLQGRGGVGKTLVAVVLAQALGHVGREPVNIDTDPVNATFSGYAALKVQRLEIMEDDEINPRSFDRLVEMIDAAKGDVIVDNGASSFVPLSHFLISNRVPSLLTEMGHQLVVHIVIAGAQSLLDTIHGFAQLARQFPPEAVFVVWLNPYYGPIEHEGKTFEQMKAYVANKERVSAIVRLPSLKKETYGRDLSEMLQARLTFDEALALGTLTIMTRQRLKIIRDQVFGQIASAAVI